MNANKIYAMTYEKIRIFATDLDGTLFQNWNTLSPYAADTLRKLRAKGIKVVISTGRPYYSVKNNIPEELYDYASCMNGQDIYCVEDQSHIYAPELSHEDVRELYGMFAKYPLILNAASSSRSVYICSKPLTILFAIRDIPRNIKRFLLRRPFVQRDVSNDPETLFEMNVAKLCFSGTERFLRHFATRLNPERFSCFFVNNCWLEIQAAGVSKGAALHQILERERLTAENAAAIGDGENDLSLLQAAGLKIAMKNAMPTLKACADEIAGHHLDDGCAHWLESHLL